MIERGCGDPGQSGIGYRILVSPAMMDRLPVMGGEMKLYTYRISEEDAMQLLVLAMWTSWRYSRC